MSVADDWSATRIATGLPAVSLPATDRRPLHRIAEVRRQQGLSLRTVCRRTGLTADEVRQQEHPATNLTLQQLVVWQQALEVPIANLLVDIDGPLSAPVLSRARMLRVLKTVQSIRETAHEAGTQRLSEMLWEQLVEAMPEFREVTAWHSVGQRRTQDEMGRIGERTIPDSFASDAMR